ncbi:MAG: hypothetical protein M3460_08445 [Actinomycetota bacterium]|nr:hypothetical protein [Actinomycetota bacterium]
MTMESQQNPRTLGEPGGGGSKQARTATVTLPFVTAQFRMPEVRMDSAVRAVRSSLPTPERAAYYGGLAALAAFSVIDWPVAAAIGVGTEIARRAATEQRREPTVVKA